MSIRLSDIKNPTPAVLVCGMVIACTWLVSWTSPDVVHAKHVLFELVLVLAVSSLMVFGVEHEVTNINPWIGAILLSITLSYFFSTYKPPSIGIVVNRAKVYSPGTFSFFTVLLGVAWYCLIVVSFNKDNISWLLDAMCVIAIVNIAFLYSQRLGYDPINSNPQIWATGITANPNHASALLAFCLPAFFRGRWIYGIVLFLPAFVFTTSLGGVVSAALGILFYLTMTERWVWGVIICSGALIYYDRNVDRLLGHSFDTRLQMWGLAWDRWQDHWLLGHGIGQWQTALHEVFYVKKQTVSWHARAHNEFVQLGFEGGALGLLAVAGYLVDVLRRAKRQALIPLTALVIIIANCCVNFPFHVPTPGIVAVTWLAILEIQLREA